ncbi:hypothetical protein WHK45_14535, partial [Staphylococcus aureus]|uniref:hypothetical protein n=1 Tax=Staphylococcus aureus TaxID=1280 RepID=UPI0039BE9636
LASLKDKSISMAAPQMKIEKMSPTEFAELSQKLGALKKDTTFTKSVVIDDSFGLGKSGGKTMTEMSQDFSPKTSKFNAKDVEVEGKFGKDFGRPMPPPFNLVSAKISFTK